MSYLSQIEWVYSQLQSLSTETLVKIVDELGGESAIPKNSYQDMALDVYRKAKAGYELTHKQKRVMVNIIGQPQ